MSKPINPFSGVPYADIESRRSSRRSASRDSEKAGDVDLRKPARGRSRSDSRGKYDGKHSDLRKKSPRRERRKSPSVSISRRSRSPRTSDLRSRPPHHTKSRHNRRDDSLDSRDRHYHKNRPSSPSYRNRDNRRRHRRSESPSRRRPGNYQRRPRRSTSPISPRSRPERFRDKDYRRPSSPYRGGDRSGAYRGRRVVRSPAPYDRDRRSRRRSPSHSRSRSKSPVRAPSPRPYKPSYGSRNPPKKFKFDSPPRHDEILQQNSITNLSKENDLLRFLQGNRVSTYVPACIQALMIMSTSDPKDKDSISPTSPSAYSNLQVPDTSKFKSELSSKDLSVLEPLRNSIVREVLVSGIPGHISGDWLLNAMNNAFSSLNPLLGPSDDCIHLWNKKPCLQFYLSEHNHHEGCLLLRSIEEASLLLSTKHITLDNTIHLSFSRPPALALLSSLLLPSSPTPTPSTPSPPLLNLFSEQILTNVKGILSGKEDQSEKTSWDQDEDLSVLSPICFAGIPSIIGEDLFKQILESFGELSSYKFLKNTALASVVNDYGFAIAQFKTVIGQISAIHFLHGYRTICSSRGSSQLSVDITSENFFPGIIRVYKKEDERISSVLEDLLSHNELLNKENVEGEEGRERREGESGERREADNRLLALSGTTGRIVYPSKCLCIKQFATIAELYDESTYDEIMIDIRLELEKIGNVSSFIMPRPRSVNDWSTPGVGCCFAEFENIDHSMMAKRILDGRKFGLLTVSAFYFSSKKMHAHDFTDISPNTDKEETIQ